jgi:hypothetical protein
MENVLMVKGYLNDRRHILLEEPIDTITGEVEVIIRSIKTKDKTIPGQAINLLKEIESLLKNSPITSFQGIDAITWQRQIRSEWDR